MPVQAAAEVLFVELPPERSEMYLQKYILHQHRYFTSKDQQNKFENIFFNWTDEDE